VSEHKALLIIYSNTMFYFPPFGTTIPPQKYIQNHINVNYVNLQLAVATFQYAYHDLSHLRFIDYFDYIFGKFSVKNLQNVPNIFRLLSKSAHLSVRTKQAKRL
jgi:hypothetical protein